MCKSDIIASQAHARARLRRPLRQRAPLHDHRSPAQRDSGWRPISRRYHPPPSHCARLRPQASLAGEWSVFVPVDYYQLVVPFMTQQYGDEHTSQLALLVHTNTGCEYEDHSKWALWAGQKWQVQSFCPPPFRSFERASPCLSCTPSPLPSPPLPPPACSWT